MKDRLVKKKWREEENIERDEEKKWYGYKKS